MLKKIKNFFKWIADHTAISWILGKLGWKNHHPNDKVSRISELESRAGNSFDNRVHTLLQDQDKPGVCDIMRKGNDRYLVLHVRANDISKVVCDSIENIKENLSEYSAYIECAKSVFKVTLGRVLGSNPFYSSFNVCSIMPHDCITPCSELEEMKSMLGLSGAVVIITQISKDLSDTERSGSKRVRLVPPSEAHDRALEEKREMEEQLPEKKASSSACLEEEDEKFFDAEDDGITQPRQTTEAVVTKKYYIFNP